MIYKNKFKEILAIIDSNKFNYKNKIGEFKYTDIKGLVNNIKGNTISEIDAKKLLNALNKIKKQIIKYKKCTPGHKKLNLLNIILTDKTESQENEKVESRKENEDYENEDKNYEYENEDENEKLENENEEDDDDETIDQNKIIKGKNDHLDEIIDKSKSFEDQIESFKKVKNVDNYYYYENDFNDKELKYNYFKIKLAHLSNEIDEMLFEQIFGHTTYKISR